MSTPLPKGYVDPEPGKPLVSSQLGMYRDDEEEQAQELEQLRQAEANAANEEVAAEIARKAAPDTPVDVVTQRLLTILENQNKLIEKLTKQNEERESTGPIPQVPLARAKFETPWNPTGARYRVEFKRPTYINGHRLREIMHSEEEITLLNQLKAGRYGPGKRWVVLETDGDVNDGGATKLNIYWPNKTLQQRMDLKNYARNLTEMLQQMISEQKSVVLA